jgi:hypothetical protein
LILARLLPQAYAAFNAAAGLSEQKTG